MAYKFLLASLPSAGSALYLTYLHITLSRSVQCQTTSYLQDKSITIPDTVQNSSENYIIHHECARKTISTAHLGASKSEMMVLFLRHTMAIFSKRPPAWGIWYMIKDAKDRNTFDSTHIRSLQFVLGDRVCGVYVVASHDKERITLTLDAPGSYERLLVEGMLVIEVKEEGDQTTFINHTTMWREKGKGNAGVLEGVVGRWMHGLMVRGLIESGVRKLSAEIEEKKRLCGV